MIQLPDPLAPDPKNVAAMFDNLAEGYDLFNLLASLGTDRFWRAALIHSLIQNQGAARVLDLGCGTGDLVWDYLTSLENLPPQQLKRAQVLGVDISQAMLQKAKAKLSRNPRLAALASWKLASAENLELSAATIDAVISAFVLRNVKKILPQALSEIHRVLVSGGRVYLLEMHEPPGFLQAAHRFYLKFVVGNVGRMVFGKRWSGDYLAETIRHFGPPQEFSRCLEAAGFASVKFKSLFGGLAVLHEAQKK